MAYDNNPINNRDNNYQLKSRLNESEEQRTRRQNRIGVVILALVALAFIAGYIATTDRRTENAVITPTTATNTYSPGTGEAAIAPSAGNARETTGNTITTTTTTNTTATPAPVTEPATQNPKVYISEESCRSSVNGACQPVAGGWTAVNPAPDKTAVPETMAAPMTVPAPSNNAVQ